MADADATRPGNPRRPAFQHVASARVRCQLPSFNDHSGKVGLGFRIPGIN